MITRPYTPYFDTLDDLLTQKIFRLFMKLEDAAFITLGDWPNKAYAGSDSMAELEYPVMRLPREHPMRLEIIRVAKSYISEVPKFDQQQLRLPQYSRAFDIAQFAQGESMLDELCRAAYHVINQNILTRDEPPEEHDIMFEASQAMETSFSCTPSIFTPFLDHCYEKECTLPFMLKGYCLLKNLKAIAVYTELFHLANGKDIFIHDGVKKGISFSSFFHRIKKAFPDADIPVPLEYRFW